MELREGYKKTEVGVIPRDWKLISFGEAFDFLSTASYSRAQLSDNEEITYVHYGDIHTKWNHFLNFKQNTLPTVSNKQSKHYHLIKEGDIVMADASEDYDGICKSVEVKNIGLNKAISGLHTFLLRDKTGVFVNGFKGYIHSNKLVKDQFDRLATGLKVYGVSKNNLRVVEIPLPPTKAEQTAIATALSDVDALIQSMTTLISKKRNIKQGAMQELLKPKDGWVVKKLGEVADVIRGASPRPIDSPVWFDEGSKIGWVRISDVTKSNKYLKETTQKLSELGIKSSRFIKNSNLIMSICATVGRPILIELDVCIHDGFVAFANPIIEKEYLYYFLTYIENAWSKYGQTGSQMNLNTELINATQITIPKQKPEQNRIATILSDMDKEIAALETKLQKYKRIKQGMMQELLTGKTRLI